MNDLRPAPTLVQPDTPTVLPAASLRSALPTPFIFGYPERILPGRAWLKVSGFSADAVERVGIDDEVTRNYLEQLNEVGLDTNVHIAFVRPSLFGWAIVDVSSLASPLVRPDENATRPLIDAIDAHQSTTSNTSKWHKPLFTPNDPGMPQMWHLDAIGAEIAWDQSTGNANTRVGVIDSGTLRAHQDINAKDIGGFDFISFTEISADSDGRDAEYNDPGDGADCGNGFRDDSWHGTHVAGTIVAAANNGVGIAGVNHQAQLMTARALGQCGGADSDILEAMAWLAGFEVPGVATLQANERSSVINLSLGADEPCSQADQNFVTSVSNAGTIIVGAAGNSGNNIGTGSPASCTGVIAVAAHAPGPGRPLANYSNFDNRIDIVAPGGEQVSSFDEGVLSLSGPNTDDYVFQQGTSMAAPHVAGIVSLMQAVSPGITRDSVVSLLQSTGDPCTRCGAKVAARLDLALAQAAGLPPPPPPEGEFGVAPCAPDGTCPTGQRCLGTPAQTSECFPECAAQVGCDAGTQCLTVQPSPDLLSVCINTGNLGEGENCEALTDCGVGLLCLGTGPDVSTCFARCDLDFECSHPDQTCQTSNDGTFAFCTPLSEELDPIDPVAPPPDLPPDNNPGVNVCDSARGNWDCPNGFGCFNDECVSGAEGGSGTGGVCDADLDCAGGLCDRGVCTTPCEFGCRDGFVCDEEAIPGGGMCRPESCLDSQGSICESGWVCTYTAFERYVCTVDGEDAFAGPFNCTSTSGAGGSLAAIFITLLALRRRTRRR